MACKPAFEIVIAERERVHNRQIRRLQDSAFLYHPRVVPDMCNPSGANVNESAASVGRPSTTPKPAISIAQVAGSGTALATAQN